MKKVLALAALCAGCAPSKGGPAADLIVTHGAVWTVDSENPTAEAVAILGDRIVAVGSSQDVVRWQGPETRVIDARGRRVLPGFNDAHVHLVQAGAQLANVQLKDAATPQEFRSRIGDKAESLGKGQWVLGGDWDEQLWNPARLPTRELIDDATSENPVLVIRYDGHMALANSLALRLAGIGRATKDPPGGEIVRDRNGEPTGVLKVAAMDLVERVVPPMSYEDRRRAALRGLEHAASLGVTSLQDMTTSWEDLHVFMDLAAEDKLTSRIYVAPPERRYQDLAKLGIKHAFGTPFLRLGALKGFVDGSLGSSTARFFEPYTDSPGNRGELRPEIVPLDEARERLIAADAAGLQICLHAVGDEGNSIALDLAEVVAQANGERDRRFRIEHAQHLVPKDFDRFAALGVIASVQPYQAIDDGRWAEARIGPERAKTTYAFKSLLDKGVRLALGTDWNGAPLEPMWTLYAAVTRATLDGKHPQGWIPQEKLTLEQAIEAYTVGSAYAEFQENDKGSITPGKLADLVILSDDVFSLPVDKLPQVRVEQTIVGGQVVYSSEK